MRFRTFLPSLAALFGLTFAVAGAQAPMSDADYMAKVATGAPAAVVHNATIVRMGDRGAMRVLQTGSNGFTCMVAFGAPMCADRYAMSWAHALQTKAPPPAGTGLIYMLAGDSGTNNADPYATGADAHAHWVVTGPHVMIVGSGVTGMGYPAGADADNSSPYVMWPTTPYAHLMIPVSASP